METLQDLSINHLHGNFGVTEKIRKAMYESAKQFVYIGFLLKEVRDHKYYEEGGYENVYAYAEFELGFKKSSTKNFIAIAENFGTQTYTYQGIRRESQTMCLQQQYEKFNYSQLVELLAMSEPQRAKAKPEMTVKQLRCLKKEETETIDFETPDQAIVSSQTSGQDERWIPFRGRTPQSGRWKMKLVAYYRYEGNNKRQDMALAFWQSDHEQWTDQRGSVIPNVTHYRELPEMPEIKK